MLLYRQKRAFASTLWSVDCSVAKQNDKALERLMKGNYQKVAKIIIA